MRRSQTHNTHPATTILIVQEWVSAVKLAVVIVLISVTPMLGAHSFVLAIIDRVRLNRDDPPGHQAYFDLVA